MKKTEIFHMLTGNAASGIKADYCLDMAELFIKSYCGIAELPPELSPCVSSVAADIYNGASDGALSGVKSVRQGDTAVTYGDSEKARFLSPYYPVLNAWRRLRV